VSPLFHIRASLRVDAILPCAAVGAITAILALLLAAGSASATAPTYGYQVLHVYPHDSQAYTEGLIVTGAVVYEGTGLTGGRSVLQKTDLPTGRLLKQHHIPSNYFGEGVTALADSIYQLTWQNHVGYTYVEGDSFQVIKTWSYPWEGWGLTHDGTYLVASDGTPTIRFLQAGTRQLVRQIQVHDGATPINWLNELEYIQGRIYANIWGYDRIAVINSDTGSVEAFLDLSGLRDSVAAYPNAEVLNGIAFDPAAGRLLVTGKFWPKMFEIDVPTLHSTDVDRGGLQPAPALRLSPNPCSRRAEFRLTLPSGSPVSLRLYDAQGRLWRTLLKENPGPGLHTLDLDVRTLPSGAYLAVLDCGGAPQTGRLFVIH
jgi:glutaminyl-peptide cyclotransferase